MKKAFLSAMLVALSCAMSAADPASLRIQSRQRGVDTATVNNLKQIYTLMMMAADDGNGAFPARPGAAGLAEAAVAGNIPARLFIVASDRKRIAAAAPDKLTEANTSFHYFGDIVGRPGNAGNKLPLLIEKSDIRNGNRLLVLFADGHCAEIESARPGVLSAITALRERAGAAPGDELWKKFAAAAEKFEAAGKPY